MADVFSAANIKNNLLQLIRKNPKVRNAAIAGFLEAQITNFKGYIRVSNSSIRSGKVKIAAKKIKISPYGYLTNILISIKRFFLGVEFQSEPKSSLSRGLREGRRITIYCPLNETEKEKTICEENRKGFFYFVGAK